MKKILAFVGTAALVGSALAADTYYWHDSVGDHDIANKENWTKNNQTTVPDTFPPTLDTATSGTTHPYIRFAAGGTLALSNNTETTLQDMVFPTADTDWTIDIGSKTLRLFGNCDSCIWVGENKPNGQRITLKSGTITRVQAAQRHSYLRFGGSVTTDAKPSYFRLDGTNARMDNLVAAVESANCEFCVTNGAKYYSNQNYSLRLSSGSGADTPNSRIVISGKDTLVEMSSNGYHGFFFGDNLNAPYTYVANGGAIVNDGATLNNFSATIGNKKGNFSVLVDNAKWQNGQFINLSAAATGTSTNNVLTVRNNSSVAVSSTFSVGVYGGHNLAEFYDSTASLGNIYIGQNQKGSAVSAEDYFGHNRMIVSNSTVSSAILYLGQGGGIGANVNDNSFLAMDSTVTLGDQLSVGWWGGRNKAEFFNSQVSATGSGITIGARGPGPGYNTLALSNSTLTVGSQVHVGGGTSSGANACNNTMSLMDSTIVGNVTWYMGQGGGGTNHLVFANVAGPISSLVLGRRNDGHNTALITNCTNLAVASIEAGGHSGTSYSGTDGNVVRIVDSTLGTKDTPTTQISIGNSVAGYPSKSNRVEFVRSSWYNKVTYLGIGGWNSNTKSNDYNAIIVDDHSSIDSTYGGNNVSIGRYGIGNMLEVKNGSTFLANGIALGDTHADHAFTGTNVLYVGKDALVSTPGFFQTCVGGNMLIVEDGTFKMRALRSHYWWSDKQNKTIDGMSAAVAELKKTAFEIWGTRYILKGTHPVIRMPDDDTTSNTFEFYPSQRLEFELPAEPYAAAPLQSAIGLKFYDGTLYQFDCSKVSRVTEWREYPLAQTDGTLTISAAELARVSEAFASAAKTSGFKGEVVLSADGKTLKARICATKGTVIMIN